MIKNLVLFALWVCVARGEFENHWTESFVGGWVSGHMYVAESWKLAYDVASIECSFEHGECSVVCWKAGSEELQ